MIPIYERFLADFKAEPWQKAETAAELTWRSIFANCQRILSNRQHFFDISEGYSRDLFPSLYYGLDLLAFSRGWDSVLAESFPTEVEQQLLLHEPRIAKVSTAGFSFEGPVHGGHFQLDVFLYARRAELGFRTLKILLNARLKTVEVEV